MKIIITGACGVSARSVARSLRISDKFRDATLIGWDMATTLYGLYEGLFDRIYRVPAVSASEYREVAEKILQDEKPDAAIVVPEVEVLHWAEHPFNIPCLLPPVNFCRLAISKKEVSRVLAPHHLAPENFQATKQALLAEDFSSPLAFPVWVRDASAGTASGKGSFKAENVQQLRAWAQISTGIDEFQISQYLPGGNYGVFMIFDNGMLKKLAIAERMEYVMARVAVSGVTGNTGKGRLLNDETVKSAALGAIDIICRETGTTMNGLVVCDMKADENGVPLVTEINIRHVAFSSSFASAGFNISEYQLLIALGRGDELSPDVEATFPEGNLILRDIDGLPIYLDQHFSIAIGEQIEAKTANYAHPPCSPQPEQLGLR